MTWWAGGVGYEVYLRSFADGDADGVGDLRGLLDRLEHLRWLGVDIVWVTPFYPSPMHDHGYDVADYCDVDPTFGRLALFDELVRRAHEMRLRVVIDLVPNHTSWEHPWFRSARSSRDDSRRHYYIWRDPAPGGGPPNNWTSVFGGPAWTLDEATGQYWLHLFLREQPDLNWRNPAVRDEFDRILRFWLERGVDGFRIDVAHALTKDPALRDNPPASVTPAPDYEMGTRSRDWERLDHVHDTDQSDVLDVYRRWHDVVAPYDALLLGEVYLLDADRLERYIAGGDGLHMAFWFQPLHLRWGTPAFVESLRAGAALPQGRMAWVQGSHDRRRAASRYGGGELGRRRQLAVAVAQMGLPGVPFVYQGEELGLEDAALSDADVQDPLGRHEGGVEHGRDIARTPMPWEPGRGMGFTDAARPWLPFGGREDLDTVAVQRDVRDSMARRYRELIGIRRRHIEHAAALSWLDSPPAVLAYRRGDVCVVVNLGDDEVAVDLGGRAGDLLFGAGDVTPGGQGLRLGGAAAAIVRVA